MSFGHNQLYLTLSFTTINIIMLLLRCRDSCLVPSLFILLSLSFSKSSTTTASTVQAASVETDGNVFSMERSSSFDIAGLIASLPTSKFYINGTWTEPKNHSSFLDVVDPSTAKVVAKVALGGPQDVDAAVLAAKEAWLSWSYHTTPKERQRLVQKLIQIYSSLEEEMAQLVSTEMGAPIASARSSHVGGGIGNIRSSLKMMTDHFEYERSLPNIHPERGDRKYTTVIYESIGVVGMITPWNWPLNQITLKVIPALLVGCTCILKPSEESPLSALLFAEMMHQARFPPGVFNLVSGDGPTTGDALTRNRNVDMISFTGSTRAGKLVAANAAVNLKRTALELGGKGANILFADVGEKWMKESVVEGVESVFYNSGQTCNAPTRLFVERPYYEMAVKLAKDVAQERSVDSAHVEGGDHIGPVVNLRQFEQIQHYIQVGIDEGATLIAGGLGRPEHLKDSKGYYVRPTIFADCKANMTIMQEEIFGPVLCITPFDTEAEALELANDTPYGLTNYVQTRNPKRRRRFGRLLQAGMIEMNDAYANAGSPFGGIKGSGYGREGGIHGLEEFCIIKAVTGYDEMEDDLDDIDDEELRTDDIKVTAM